MKEKLDNNETKQKKKKNILLIALKKHKVSLAFVLFFVFASTTFAWFIYNKTVDMGLQAHVKTWDIHLASGDGDTYQFNLSDLYPGMPQATDSVRVVNAGEMDASLSFTVKSLILFGEEKELNTDYTVTVNNGVYTINGFPFELSFSLTADSVVAGDSTTLSFVLDWDYANSEPECQAIDQATGESYNKCDVEDTELGEKSYEYAQTHPDDPSLAIVLKLQFQEVNPNP